MCILYCTVYTYICVWFLGILLSNLVCKLMLAHLTNTSYSIVRYELVPFIAACINAIVLEKALINEVYTLYALLLISCSLHAHFIINVIDDMTHILGIRCF